MVRNNQIAHRECEANDQHKAQPAKQEQQKLDREKRPATEIKDKTNDAAISTEAWGPKR